MKTTILGVAVDALTQEEVLKKIMVFLTEDKNHLIVTPNPEMIVEAVKNEQFNMILKKADLVVPDGIGVVLASKLNKIKIKERVPGCDLILKVFEQIKDKEYSVYFLGAAPGVCEKACENLKKQYRGLKIAGFHDGYFKKEDEKIIIKEIKNLKPDILIVGMGFPRQEYFISENQKILPVKLSFALGGTIDVIAGTVKRAPVIYQKLGLEWFYRLLKQPSRFKRMLCLPKFVFMVLGDKIVKRSL